jgi:transcriptional regulator with XRE-family HTH domain
MAIKHYRPNKALKTIRESVVVGDKRMDQRTFAKRVGSSSSIAAIESGNRQMTQALAMQIMAFTGCDPAALVNGEAKDILGRPYTAKTFKQWQEAGGEDNVVHRAADRAGALVRGLILAAGRDSSGTPKPHRFREVLLLLSDYLQSTARNFDLGDRVTAALFEEEQLRDPSPWQEMTLDEARKRFAANPAWHSVDRGAEQGWQKIEVREWRSPVWAPLAGAMADSDGGPPLFTECLRIDRVVVEVRLPWSKKTVRLKLRDTQINALGQPSAGMAAMAGGVPPRRRKSARR